MSVFLLGSIHFDWSVFVDRLIHPDGQFARALAATVYISVIAQAIGVLLGLALALCWLSRIWPLRIVSVVYVTIFRGTPLIVQIFFVYFGAGLFLGVDLFPREMSFGFFSVGGALMAGIAALALNEGAYMSEIIRAGINSVDRGQMDSALSVGMPRSQAMRLVILPQAARIIVPPLGNDFNSMMKNSSLVAFIGVYELFQDAQVHYSTTFMPAEYFSAVAVWYLVLTLAWTLIQSRIERRLSSGVGSPGPRARGARSGLWPLRGRRSVPVATPVDR